MHQDVREQLEESALFYKEFFDAKKREYSARAESMSKDPVLIRAANVRGSDPLVVMSDRGPENMAEETQEYLASRLIVHLPNLPYTPEHNARNERAHRDRFLDRGRACVFDLAQEHVEIQSRARVTCQARAAQVGSAARWRPSRTSPACSTITWRPSSSTWISTRPWRR